MSQPTSLKTQLSKALLITGIISLVASFFMFYWASRVDWEYITKYQNIVQFDESNYAYIRSHHDLGELYYQHVPPFGYSGIHMSSGDYLAISYDTPTNGTVYIIPYNGVGEDDSMLPYTNNSLLDYQASEGIIVVPVFATDNLDNTLSTTIIFHHYEKPEWGRFAFGIILASLAVVSVFESKSAVKLSNTPRTAQESEERKT